MSELSDALSVLAVMKGAAWPAQEEIYIAALRLLPVHLLQPAVSKLAGEAWRPAPFDVIREAAKIEMCHRAGTRYPFPSADEAYAEIMHKISEFGMNGHMPYIDRPNLRVAGAPPFSHPLVAKTVALIGGWECICSGEANMSEGLSKQVKAVYERQAERWVESAASSLCAGESETRFFPRWRPWEVAIDWQEEATPRLAISAAPEAVPCPPEILRLLKGAGVSIESEQPRRRKLAKWSDGLDGQKLREIERELREGSRNGTA